MSLGIDTSSEILNQQVKNTAARGNIYYYSRQVHDHAAANGFSPANANGTNINTVQLLTALIISPAFLIMEMMWWTMQLRAVHVLSTYIGWQILHT